MGAGEEAKNEGNSALNEGRLEDAIACYTKAIGLEPENHVFYSNRSAANTRAKKFDAAVSDAERCIALKPDWARGYSRHGYALLALKRFEEAAAAYQKGLDIDSGDQSMRDGLKKAQTMAQIAAAAKEAGAKAPGNSTAGDGDADQSDAPLPRRQKPDVDKRKLGLLVFGAMVLGQVAYYAIGRGVPMLYTMGFVMLAFQLGFVPVKRKKVD